MLDRFEIYHDSFPESSRSIETIAAREARAAGVHWTYAPMMDIARDPRWGRIAEGAGEDLYLASFIASARVQGFQGGNPLGSESLIACLKHFAAYGAAEAGRDYRRVDISERILREIYLPPFAAGIRAGALSLMTAFHTLNGIPATARPFLLGEILRTEWAFQGLVVSDYPSVRELITGSLRSNENLRVEATVRNNGERSGWEVVQLYIRDRIASTVQPVRKLRGFPRRTPCRF